MKRADHRILLGLALAVNEVGATGRLGRVGRTDALAVVWLSTVKGKGGIQEASVEAVRQ